MKKKIIFLILIFVIIAGGLMSFIFFYNAEAGISEENDILNKENNILSERDERTKEDFIAVLLNNKEDFDYVVEAMKPWAQKKYSQFINFYLSDNDEIVIDDRFSTNNQEIADEILNNTELYNHLLNIYNLNEITRIICSISSEGYQVYFRYSKYPKNYHGGLWYMERIMHEVFIYEIDRHWALEMVPNE